MSALPPPRTAAVILHFRTPQRTLECLRSLADEGLHEIALVDNSEDGGASLSLMQSGLKELRATGMAIHLVEPGYNLGFAVGVNRAIEHLLIFGPTRILLINSDARLLPGALEKLQQAIHNGNALALPGLQSKGTYVGSSIHGYQRWLALILPVGYPGTIPYPTGACLLFAEGTACLGLFDEDFFFYGEDVALGYRLFLSAASIMDVPAAVVEHAGAASACNGSLFYEYHIVRGHLLLARKLTHSRCSYLLALCARGLTLPSRACFRALGSRSLVPLYALWMAAWDVASGRMRPLTPPFAP